MRHAGTVRFFNQSKGYGFITPDAGGPDVFLHATALEEAKIPPVSEGDRLSFEIVNDARSGKKRAGKIREA